uniref:Uncharacterized protein n=1 Tax=Rhizophora mucronata TaxID=61149 RepID=A0A2P2LHS6_RHIMU
MTKIFSLAKIRESENQKRFQHILHCWTIAINNKKNKEL